MEDINFEITKNEYKIRMVIANLKSIKNITRNVGIKYLCEISINKLKESEK